MLRNVSTFPRIPRSANKLRDKMKLEGKSQLLELKRSDGYRSFGSVNSYFIVYTGRSSTRKDLTASFISNFSSSFILKRPRDTIYIIFLNYIFFWFCIRNNFSVVIWTSLFNLVYWETKWNNYLSEIFKIL